MCLLKLLFISSVVTSALSSVYKEENNHCSYNEFHCKDGACISSDLVCNGPRDCADGTDEFDCGTGSIDVSKDTILHRLKRQVSACRKDQWQCRDGSCISFDGKCDGIVDCKDGSDERHALCRKMRCQHNWFRCTYGACVDGTAPCNGIKECADNSDELLPRCRNTSDIVRGQFICQDSSKIPATNLCDGMKDCPDGSDETVRACAGKICPTYLFQCAYGACADNGADCNGIQDCADGSDEAPDLCNKNGIIPPPTNSGSGTTTGTIPKPGTCVLPKYPDHGSYVTNIPNGKPGDAYDLVTVNVTCREGYGVVGTDSIYCFNGFWPDKMPKCVRMCRLQPHPSVEYRCLVSGAVQGARDCSNYEPTGTVVSPQCRLPNYYSATTLTFMRCLDGNWDYVARCTPGLTKNGTNITILVKDKVEIHVSDIQYVVPFDYSQDISDVVKISDYVNNDHQKVNSNDNNANNCDHNIDTDQKTSFEIDEEILKQIFNEPNNSQSIKVVNNSEVDESTEVEDSDHLINTRISDTEMEESDGKIIPIDDRTNLHLNVKNNKVFITKNDDVVFQN